MLLLFGKIMDPNCKLFALGSGTLSSFLCQQSQVLSKISLYVVTSRHTISARSIHGIPDPTKPLDRIQSTPSSSVAVKGQMGRRERI